MNITMDEVTKLRNDLQDLKDKVNHIYTYIVGVERDDGTGFVSWKKETEERVTDLEKWRDRAVWVAIGMSVPTTVGIFKIVNAIMNAIK